MLPLRVNSIVHEPPEYFSFSKFGPNNNARLINVYTIFKWIPIFSLCTNSTILFETRSIMMLQHFVHFVKSIHVFLIGFC
jgi:hypothetical protein